MGEDVPAIGRDGLGVDGDHDALAADAVGGFAHQLRALHGGGVDAYLVGTGVEQAANVRHAAHAAADGERNEHLPGDGFDHVQDGVALVRAGGDVQKRNFVRAFGVVAAGDFHRVARVAQFQKLHALDHAACVDIQTGNDAFGQHNVQRAPLSSSARFCAATKSSVP